MSQNNNSKGTTAFVSKYGIPVIEGASPWIRFLARIIDQITCFVVTLVTANFVALALYMGVAIITQDSANWAIERLQRQAFIDYVLITLASIAYYTVCEGLHGSTLGKWICGLTVVNEKSGTYCGLPAALRRTLAMFVDGLFLCIPAAVSMSDSERRQRLGDRWAKTMVVKRRDLEGVMEPRSVDRFILALLGGVTAEIVIISFDLILKLMG